MGEMGVFNDAMTGPTHLRRDSHWQPSTLELTSARLLVRAKVLYIGARVVLALTAARFLTRLAVHAKGRKAPGAIAVATSIPAPTCDDRSGILIAQRSKRHDRRRSYIDSAPAITASCMPGEAAKVSFARV